MYCDWFILSLLLPTPTIWFLLHCKRRSHKRSRKKWKRSDSSDSDSIAVMSLLMTPIFDFHWVISALTTPVTTPTPSLMKPSLYFAAAGPNFCKIRLFAKNCGKNSKKKGASLSLDNVIADTQPEVKINKYIKANTCFCLVCSRLQDSVESRSRKFARKPRGGWGEGE